MKILIMILCLGSSMFSGSIKVAVAANVSYAIEDLKEAFREQHPDINVDIILGSTGKLTAQAMHGAPFQILLAADTEHPQKLYHDGFASCEPRVYAQGALVYISQKKRDMSQGLNGLLSEDITKIAMANPKTAPYGMATKEALKNAGVYEKLKSKLVYGESISQTLMYAMHITDVGIVAKSALFSPTLAAFHTTEHCRDVNASLYRPIKQAVVILKKGKDSQAVKAFYDFLFSSKAHDILQKFGYLLP